MDEEIFIEYNEENKKKNNVIPKKKAITIVVATILIIIILAGVFVAGYFTAKSNSIESDMPLLVEAYKLLKKYYYEDISWEEFQVIAAEAMMSKVDAYTWMEENDTSTSSQSLGFTIKTTAYYKHFVASIVPSSPMDMAEASMYYKTENDAINSLNGVDVSESKIKINPGDKIYAISVLGVQPVVVEGTAQSNVSTIISKSDTVTLYLRKTKGVDLDNDGEDEYEDGIYKYVVEKTNLPYTRAFYYDSESIGDTTGTTAMIRFTQFSGTAVADMYKCLNKFVDSGCNKLILDLRGNGGGDATILSYIAGCFVNGASDSEKPLIYIKYNTGDGKYRSEYVYSSLSSTCTTVEDGEQEYAIVNLPSKVNNFKLTVLCDGSTASSSEALIGALQYYNGTTIIGSTTYGKGVGQTVRYLEDGKYVLYITNSKYYIPTKGENGETNWTVSIHKTGFTPSDENYISNSYRPLKTDKYIQRALTVLGS